MGTNIYIVVTQETSSLSFKLSGNDVSCGKNLGWITVDAGTYKVTGVVVGTRAVFFFHHFLLSPTVDIFPSLIFPLIIILNCRFRFFPRVVKRQFSNSSLRTGKIKTRAMALGRSTSQRKWLTYSRFHLMPPNCTVLRRWQPSTTWWMMALAPWRYFYVHVFLFVFLSGLFMAVSGRGGGRI